MPYVIITPVRNEGAHFQQTIDSVVSQTIRPAAWVVVDDGSTDNTPQLIAAAAQKHPWLIPVYRQDRGFRKQGGGVIEAFYDGYARLGSSSSASSVVNSAGSIADRNPRIANPSGPHTTLVPKTDEPAVSPIENRKSKIENPSAVLSLQHSTTPPLQYSTPWNFLVKLDGDLSFAPNYFEDCFKHFAADPKLGIGGGRVYCQVNGAMVEDSPGDPAFHVRGATKIYRRECWDQIGGLIQAPGWDTLDEIKANMLGWKTYSFHDLRLLQLKPTGAVDGSWRNWVKNGRANYITGYHPLFMLFKCFKRTFEPPYGVAALGLFGGFFGSYLKRAPRVDDRALIKYLRAQQMRRLAFRSSLWS